MHRINYFRAGDPVGYFPYDFSSTSQNAASALTGAEAMAGYLTGVGGPLNSAGMGEYEVPLHTSTQTSQFAEFFQDNFEATGKLTINLGICYEINAPQSERYNRMNFFDPNAVSPLQTSLGTIHGGEEFVTLAHRNQYDIDWANVAPRIGFAYAMDNKTVVQGGYGIYYTQGNMGTSGTTGIGFQGYDEWTPWLTTLDNDKCTPWGRFSDAFPITGPRLPVGSSLVLLNDVGFTAAGPIPNLGRPELGMIQNVVGFEAKLHSRTLAQPAKVKFLK
jgi:hypothetical protein